MSTSFQFKLMTDVPHGVLCHLPNYGFPEHRGIWFVSTTPCYAAQVLSFQKKSFDIADSNLCLEIYEAILPNDNFALLFSIPSYVIASNNYSHGISHLVIPHSPDTGETIQIYKKHPLCVIWYCDVGHTVVLINSLGEKFHQKLTVI